MSGASSSTYQSGEFETMPPSQKKSLPICTGAKPGGNAPLAITCSGVSVVVQLSKYTELPVATLTAPTDSRTFF